MKKLSFQIKLLALISPLVLAFTALTFNNLNQTYQRKQNAQALLEAMSTFKALSHLVDKMQIERGKTALYLNAKLDEQELQNIHNNTNSVLHQLMTSPAKEDHYLTDLIAKLPDEIKAIRQAIESSKSTEESFKQYSQGIAANFKKMVAIATHYSFEGYEGQLLSLVLFEEAKENMGKFRATLSGSISAAKPLSKEQTQLLETYRSGFIVNLNSPGLRIQKQTQVQIEQLFHTSQWHELMTAYADVTTNYASGSFSSDSRNVFDNATQLIEKLYIEVISEFNTTKDAVSTINAAASREFYIYLFASTAILLLVLGLSFYSIRKIIGDMNEVEEKLKKSIHTTTQATVDLKDSSNSLASGVQEQSAALQESVAALEEIKSMVQRSVETTNNAKTFMDNSNKEAAQAQNIMNNMMHSMEQIKAGNDNFKSKMTESNQKLNEIIRVIAEIEGKTRVINEIVFQTKLLSFNASVEAARAGEHGKGFSVVADEVGKLATLSGEAAKDISSLLKDGISSINSIISQTQDTVVELVKQSDDRIQDGVENANSCREAFERITTSINEIDHLMESISAASEEQFKGIAEINSAMTQLDLVTQNSSMSANMTSYSAVNLEGQTTALSEVVKSLSEFVHGEPSQVETKLAS